MKFTLSLGLCLLLLTFVIHAEEYHVDRDAGNKVTFISDAPLEDFEGITSGIDGFVKWQDDGLQSVVADSSNELYFEVDLAGLDTGIGLRNRHMRENYLETDKHPYAKFNATISELTIDADTVVTARGVFSLHGKSHTIEIPVKLRGTAEGFRVMAEFDISLVDYDIEVPKLMFLKVDENIHLVLDFYLKKVN